MTKTILVVDDKANLRTMVESYLTHEAEVLQRVNRAVGWPR